VDLKNFISGIISQNEKLKRSFEKKWRGDEMGDRDKKGCLKSLVFPFFFFLTLPPPDSYRDPSLKQ
jgi:hypothetical protein